MNKNSLFFITLVFSTAMSLFSMERNQNAGVAGMQHDTICNAARRGDVVAVARFLEQDASLLNKKNEYGFTPLLSAVICDHKEIVQLLLDKGANVNTDDDAGCTVLHQAAGRGYKEVLCLLLSRPEVEINQLSRSDEAPLDKAEEDGDEDIIRILLCHGAEPFGGPLVKKVFAEICQEMWQRMRAAQQTLLMAGHNRTGSRSSLLPFHNLLSQIAQYLQPEDFSWENMKQQRMYAARQQAILTVCAGLHQRVGTNSSIRFASSTDIIRHIAQYLRPVDFKDRV